MLGGTFSFFRLDWQSFLITRCVARQRRGYQHATSGESHSAKLKGKAPVSAGARRGFNSARCSVNVATCATRKLRRIVVAKLDPLETALESGLK
jgi:hypothetical protein